MAMESGSRIQWTLNSIMLAVKATYLYIKREYKQAPQGNMFTRGFPRETCNAIRISTLTNKMEYLPIHAPSPLQKKLKGSNLISLAKSAPREL